MIFMMLMTEDAINLFIIIAFIYVFEFAMSINLILLILTEFCFTVIYFKFIKAFFFNLIIMTVKFTLLTFIIR